MRVPLPTWPSIRKRINGHGGVHFTVVCSLSLGSLFQGGRGGARIPDFLRHTFSYSSAVNYGHRRSLWALLSLTRRSLNSNLYIDLATDNARSNAGSNTRQLRVTTLRLFGSIEVNYRDLVRNLFRDTIVERSLRTVLLSSLVQDTFTDGRANSNLLNRLIIRLTVNSRLLGLDRVNQDSQ